LRILFTTHSYPPDVSGVSSVAAAIAEELAVRGHSVHVATGLVRGAGKTEVRNGVSIHRFDLSGNGATGIKGDPTEYQRLAISGDWDVVAMHCTQIWSTDLLVPALEKIRAVRVLINHGFSGLGSAMFREYYRSLAPRLRVFDQVFALSNETEEAGYCSENGLREPLIVPNGIRLPEFDNSDRSVREEWGVGKRPWMVSVSNHNPVKGHHTLFDVASAVAQAIPNLKATIVGGHYPAEKWGLGRWGVQGGCWYKCNLKALTDRHVDLKAGLPRPKVVAAIKEADLITVTSRWEASPIAVLEAMAAGTPWVSFDVGCVAKNAGGIVVGSVPEMKEAVKNLLQDSSLRQELGKKGRERAVEAHSWVSIVTKYENEFKRLLRDRADRIAVQQESLMAQA
jgi:glycosyltransferase involved in cell wall biosynthesis